MAITDRIVRCLALLARSAQPGAASRHEAAGSDQQAPAPHPATDPSIVQAFIEQARWMHDHHDKRGKSSPSALQPSWPLRGSPCRW